MKKKNIKIIAIAIMSLVILAGIVVVGIFGFNKELRYGQGQVINVYVEQMVDVTNIKKLVNECLAGKTNMVQTVEIYQDYVTIKAKEITEEQKNIYNLVLKNQKIALNQIRDGANIKAIVKGVESDFNLNQNTLIHSLGHGVGLEIHEAPIVGIKSDFSLKENMVITDEPRNIYSRKFWSKNRRYGTCNKERCNCLDRIK